MIVAIVNPRSGNGRAAETWGKVRAYLPGDVETFVTTGPGHAIELARTAIRVGARTVVAVGGDGTINEVVNGFFENEQEISHEVRLGIIPHGTGSDFTRILNLPRDAKKASGMLHHGEPQLVDLLKVLYTQRDGSYAMRYCINVTSFGMGGLVARRAKRWYFTATMKTALTFFGRTITVKIDDDQPVEERITNVAVGNGQYHGGGMWCCPGASLSDGMFDVTLIRYLSLYEMVKGLPTLYNGDILTHPKVLARRAKRIEATSEEKVAIEIDGDALGRLPIEISIVPKAIRLLIP